jgi:LPS-assembly lipoprotein
MSSFDRIARAAALALTLSLTLSGCFQPLYGTATASGEKAAELTGGIRVLPVPDRLGHYLVQDLVFELNNGAPPKTPRYTLELTLSEGTSTPVVNSATGRAETAVLQVSADYILTQVDTGTIVTRGRAIGAATYDRLGQRFAAARANSAAEIQVARMLAEQIRTRLAAALVTGH